MSIRAMNRVWANSVNKGSVLLLLLAVADYAQDDGTGCFAGVETLAEKTRMSARNVQYLIEKAEKSGELSVDRRASKYGTNEYTLHIGHAKFAPPTSGGDTKPTSGLDTKPTSPDSSGNPSDTEKEPLKAGKESQPDTSAPFYAVAEQIFGIKATEIPKGTRQHIGRALKALHEVEPELDAPTITDFVSWWRRGKDGAHLPLDPTKLQMHFMAFVHGRQDAGAVPEWTKVEVAYNEREGTWSVNL